MKNYLANLSKIVNKQSSSAGFTLIELLIAASLSTVVVGVTGFGVVAITENNNKSKAVTERRVELNRALDFISDEVRQAKNIATDASANLSGVGGVATDFTSTGRTPILTLEIPGVPQRVIYYIATPASNTGWLGPKVIYRWGPNFDNTGKYKPSSLNTPSAWEYEPLIDLAVASIPSPNSNCQTGWLPNPAVASREGFYACVNPNGKIAEIYLNGKLIGAYGNSIAPLKVSTKAFARSFQIASASAGGAPSAAAVAVTTTTATATTAAAAATTAAAAATTAAAAATTAAAAAAVPTPTAAAYTAAAQAATAQAAAAQAAAAAYTAAAQATAAQAAAERAVGRNEAAQATELRATAQTAAAAQATATYTAATQAAATQAAAARQITDSVFTTNNGVITFTKSATGTFKIIGGDAGPFSPYTTTTIYKTAPNGTTDTGTSVPKSGNNQQVTGLAGTKLTVRGNLGNLTGYNISGVIYGGFNANSNETNRNTQVWALRNGDTLPPFTPYGTQEPPANYLRSAGYLDANGKVKLADNQVIYLFEVTTTTKTRDDYDMQDIIVLATIT